MQSMDSLPSKPELFQEVQSVNYSYPVTYWLVQSVSSLIHGFTAVMELNQIGIPEPNSALRALCYNRYTSKTLFRCAGDFPGMKWVYETQNHYIIPSRGPIT